MNETLPEVVIVGAGFGGLRLARALRHAPVSVKLVDRRNYHLFQPLLYQVATAGLGPTDIAQPVRAILRGQRNFTFQMAEVVGVDFAARRLKTSAGEIPYDLLVLAPGGETNYFGLQSVAEQAFGLKDLDEAVRIRNHVLSAFEFAVHEPVRDVRRALLTFVIAGGGPTGVECAGALAELIRLVLIKKDYPSISIKDVRIVLLDAGDKLLAMFPERLRESAAETLWKKHVEVRFGAAVTGFNGRQVSLKGGEIIPAHTLIWAAGARASRLMDKLGVPQDGQGRAKVDCSLQLHDHPEVFVIGDAAAPDCSASSHLPMVAPVAIQQATLTARNIARSLRHEPLEKFVYKDPGSLATIGRNAAVARFGKLQFRGAVAWVLWLVVHIFFLIGLRNRLIVLINWTWDYFFYDRAIRLITHDERWTWLEPVREALQSLPKKP